MKQKRNICLICLKTDGKLYNFESRNYLTVFYNELCEKTLDDVRYPLQLCPHCAYLLKKFYVFKKKCISSQDALRKCANSRQQIQDLQSKCTPYLNYWRQNHNKIITYKQTDESSEIEHINIDNMSIICKRNMYISFLKTGDNGFDEATENLEELMKNVEVLENVEVVENVAEVMENMDKEIIINNEITFDDFESFIPHVVEDNGVNNEDIVLELNKCEQTINGKRKRKGRKDVLNVDNLSVQRRRKLLKKIKEKPKLTANDKQLLLKLDKRHKSLNELENDFSIQLYLTEEDQIEEFLKRKTEDNYLMSPFKCEICYRGFKEAKILDTHQMKHEASAGDYLCNICKIRCLTSKLHRTHRDANHTAKYSCKNCSFVTYSKAQARKHQSWHEGVVHTCQHCQMSFRKHTTLLSHLRLLHPSPHICDVCARSFVSANGLRHHKTVAHKQEQSIDDKEGKRCDECDITFATRNVYTRHVLVTPKHAELAKSIIGCTICGEQFDDNESLQHHSHKEHKRTDNQLKEKLKSLKCQECGEEFSHSSGLYHHFVKAHPTLPYKLAGSRHFLCETCGRTFNCYGSLSAHALSHSGERPFPCPVSICKMSFRTKQTRDKHATRHDTARQHACRVCGKAYSNRASLFRHKQIHSGVRKYRCNICDKAFVDGSNLRQHIQGVHHNIRRVRKR